MTPFTSLTSLAIPILRDNIDTDTVIPGREMKSTGRTGLADGLFAPWRYSEGRTPDPAFALNQPEFGRAQVIAAGANFGCGSSREHAVWALAEWGIRAIIAPSFAPIFAATCLRNGLLTIALPGAAISKLAGRTVKIDLTTQSVTGDDATWHFDIDEEAKVMLLEGLDAIDLTLKSLPQIDNWTAQDRAARPWVYLT